MLGILLIVVSLWFGERLVRLMGITSSRLERFVYGAVLGLSLEGYFALGVSYIFGFTFASQLACLLGLTLMSLGLTVWIQKKRHVDRSPKLDPPMHALTRPNWYILVTLGLIVAWLGGTTLIHSNGVILVNNVHNYGDIRLHLAYINNFLYGQNIPVESPIMSGTSPSYPFLFDFISSQIVLLGLPLVASINIVTVLGLFLIVASLYTFVLTITQNKAAASVAPWLLIFNGGIGIFTVFLQEWKSLGYNWSYLINPPRDYSLIQDKGYFLGNFTLVLFTTQRTLLLGFPLTLVVLTQLYRLKRNSPLRHYFFIGLLATCLSLVHTSSLLIIGIYLLFAGVKTLLESKKIDWPFISRWLVLMLPIVTIGLFLIMTFLGQAGSITKSMHFTPGWMVSPNSSDTFLSTWLKSGLVVIPASLLGLYYIYKKNNSAGVFVAYAYVIFSVANLLILHPWAWDNTRYFLYWYAIMTIPLSVLIVELWRKPYFIVSVVLVLSLTLSGMFDVFRRLIPNKNSYPFATDVEITQAENVRRVIPPKSYVLTYGYVLNPLLPWVSRRLVFGDEAWLWSHGIQNYDERLQNIQAIYAGDASAPNLINSLNIGYVIISKNERSRLSGLNEAFFAHRYPIVYRDGDGLAVYKVK